MTSDKAAPLGVLETREAISDGRLTAVAATERLLEHTASLEDSIGAWVHIDAEGALENAARLDKQSDQGPLHGISFGVKDLFAVKGMPWRCGSPIWKDRTADFDAAIIAKLRQTGGMILGKTETTEFAGYKPSRTHNPVAHGRTPGGSSSGSAAAVACGMVPIAFGTQTSGSIIRPASFCGVVGYKPSFDMLETSGIAPLSRSFDTVGLFARHVGDISYTLEALSGLPLVSSIDAHAELPPIEIFRSAAWDHADETLVSAWKTFEAALSSLDLPLDKVIPGTLSKSWDDILELHARLMALEASEALAHEAAIAPQLLSPGLAAQLQEGRSATASQRLKDRLAFTSLRAEAITQLPPNAVWLTPSACGSAPDFDAGTGNPAFNRTWSLLGLPCCSIPLLKDNDGNPIGVQVVGAMGNDRAVLAVADYLMKVMQG